MDIVYLEKTWSGEISPGQCRILGRRLFLTKNTIHVTSHQSNFYCFFFVCLLIPCGPRGPFWCAAWDHCISCRTPGRGFSVSRGRWSDASPGQSWGNNCSHTPHTCSSSTENITNLGRRVLAGHNLTWACCWLMWCFRLVNSLKQWGHLASFFSLDLVLTVLLGAGGSSSSCSLSSCSCSCSSLLQRGSSTVSSDDSAAAKYSPLI